MDWLVVILLWLLNYFYLGQQMAIISEKNIILDKVRIEQDQLNIEMDIKNITGVSLLTLRSSK